MADWDDEEFEPEDPTKNVVTKTDKWEGEDSDDDAKDNWDDDSDEEKKSDESKGDEVKAIQKKKKKKLADIIAEKEAKKLAELEEKRRQAEEDEANMTPEAKLAQKLERQRLEEERELELAKDMLGCKDEVAGMNFRPSNKEEFNQLSSDLLEKFRGLENNDLYQDFAIALISGMATNLNVPTLKKIKSEAEAFVSAKLKEEKAAKAGKGKKTKGASLRMDTDRAMMGRGLDDGYNDMDDFM